jgi:CheY-like chemotaxis protein
LILVVDDNNEAAELLARHLDKGGFRMAIARTGNEALTMARSLQPAAITLDIQLPGIDGWEVLSRLKADEATRNIPVVVVSVADNPGLGRALGALDYFVKPVDGNALLSRLSQYTLKSVERGGPIRVVVVDDEKANLDLLEALLMDAGFGVVTVQDGQEAIDTIKAAPPDLVLLDLLMPRVSGFDVVEALRADERTRSIPIMVLTAKVVTADDRKVLNGHAAAVFERSSLAGPELIYWLRDVVAKRRAT